MHVSRGRAATIVADRERTDDIVNHARERREQALRVWRPHRQVAFGRRDGTADGYEFARAAAEERSFPATTRDVGGRAVAFAGSTVAAVHAIPVDGPRGGIESRYAEATAALLDAFESLGVNAREGEPERSFCPGSHSVQAEGKIAGLAQRLTGDVATVASVVVVSERDTLASVYEAVYEPLGVPFDPSSLGSVERAGGPADPGTVADALAAAIRRRA